MKNLYTLLAAFMIAAGATGQVFWTEDFGTGCNTGNYANGFTTTNGVWVVTDISAPATYANEWYISGHTRNTGVGVCADDCVGGNNQTLHVGSVPVALVGLTAEQGSYLTGFYCPGFNICSTTHKRVETPVMDCSGKTSITFSCIYFEGGDVPGGLNGDCSIWFFDGSTWTLLDPLAKTNNAACSGTIYGVWANYSISLPPSADNNPNVKLGFQWDNNDVSAGSDPSAAFDDLALSSGSLAAPVAGFIADTTSGCDSICVMFTDTSQGATSRVWSFPGGTPATSTSPSQMVCYNSSGNYDVTLISSNTAGTDTATQVGYIQVSATPVPDFSVSDQSLCAGECVNFTDLTSGTVQSYTWTFAGGFPLNSNQQNPSFICYQTAGDFSVTLTVENGVCTNSNTHVAYINVHQAAVPSVTLAGDTLTSSPALTYQWYELSTGAIPAGIFQNYVATLPGEYFVCIQDAFGCSACSDTVLVNPGGVIEITDNNISVYPNPAGDYLFVLNRGTSFDVISVEDILGKKMEEVNAVPQAGTASIDIHTLSSGMYWVELRTDDKIFRKKFVKE